MHILFDPWNERFFCLSIHQPRRPNAGFNSRNFFEGTLLLMKPGSTSEEMEAALDWSLKKIRDHIKEHYPEKNADDYFKYLFRRYEENLDEVVYVMKRSSEQPPITCDSRGITPA